MPPAPAPRVARGLRSDAIPETARKTEAERAIGLREAGSGVWQACPSSASPSAAFSLTGPPTNWALPGAPFRAGSAVAGRIDSTVSAAQSPPAADPARRPRSSPPTPGPCRCHQPVSTRPRPPKQPWTVVNRACRKWASLRRLQGCAQIEPAGRFKDCSSAPARAGHGPWPWRCWWASPWSTR